MGCASSSSQSGKMDVPNPMNAGELNLDEQGRIVGLGPSMFELGKELGKGCFATVHLSSLKRDKTKQFAIKKMDTSQFSSLDWEGLELEIDILTTVNHPNIMKFYGHWETHNRRFMYLVTELIVGGELFDRVVKLGYYTEKIAQKCVVVFLEALEYLASLNIAHRDLKPENLLLVSESDDFVIKIADFGFATHVPSGGLDDSCGTPGYLAPEIILRKKYTGLCDIWSAGVIVYILLSGCPPFYDKTEKALYKKIIKGNYRFTSPEWDNISESARSFVRSMLTVNPKERPTASQLLKHDWLTGVAVEVHLGDVQSQLKSFKARNLWRVAIKTVLAAQRMKNLAAMLRDINLEDGDEKDDAESQ